MTIIVANKDGSSNAAPGDVVVTGGGIYQKNTDGSSTKLSGLKDYIGTEKTGDYNVLQTVAQSFAARQSVQGGRSDAVVNNVATNAQTAPVQPDYWQATGADENGLVSGVVFSPVDYSSSSGSSASSSGLNKIMGYVIVGLVGLAILDRFVGGGKRVK